ncbi:SDR family NAD(P)-dependent oxidoreductase [Pseudogracilibacillus auburnensis]|uniref:NAD(P)-dependent dehydrogenase (Short-subunit alcohol dehydrogenase family) n=1 Tax=Pseudogracilibacillus auburnensis TaxID=1494959 RepID=A0A2V3WDF4_9BACI|nr:SDR family oxidoreductase [Pseudogracilibacillus auburnensis]PXW90225.1 NAD(P)-dependent dehydrogenase (short-subunit alcohol dehydrogenase family) [Pseudogracilibacillus auburnensis]
MGNYFQPQQCFNNKVVLLLNGLDQIGETLMKLYDEAGAKVYYFNRSEESFTRYEMFKLSSTQNKKLGMIDFQSSNVEEELRHLMDGEIEKIDVFINNLEHKVEKDLLDITPLEWNDGLFVNLHIPFIVLKSYTTFLEASSQAVIIHLTSPHAIHGGNGEVSYAACKSALESFNKGLSRALGAQIRANGVSFDSFQTLRDEKASSVNGGTVPIKSQATLSDITNIIMFLSSSLATYINGQVLLVDGGKTYS